MSNVEQTGNGQLLTTVPFIVFGTVLHDLFVVAVEKPIPVCLLLLLLVYLCEFLQLS